MEYGIPPLNSCSCSDIKGTWLSDLNNNKNNKESVLVTVGKCIRKIRKVDKKC